MTRYLMPTSIASLTLAGCSTMRGPLIIPRPRVEKMTGDALVLVAKDAPLSIAVRAEAVGAVAEGAELLKRRLEHLGHDVAEGNSAPPQIVVTRCSDGVVAELIKSHDIRGTLEPERIKQAYYLASERTPAGTPIVNLKAAHDLGLFYGMVSLSQLLEVDDAGNLMLPAGEILDFPEIACRLAKTSAAANPPDLVARFAAWLPLYKFSQIGLQYHGHNSKNPGGNFSENIRTLCPKLRRAGTLESIVYFCPFRSGRDEVTGEKSGAYDLASARDRAAYAKYLLWIMAQGAHGIEVDYNDWPGSRDVPIAEVLNLAVRTLEATYPDAYVLYCPPSTGKESYRGMATPEMRETLSQVSAKVWPLWTGMHTLITKPLKARQVKRWTKIAGRRPFLWVNRVVPDMEHSFSRKVAGLPNQRVFRAELLPKGLNRLFEGVHLNTGLDRGYNELSGGFDPGALAYLATAADYLWNPRDFKAAESYRRARRFVEIMLPLVADGETGRITRELEQR